jgi:hypothetical protein
MLKAASRAKRTAIARREFRREALLSLHENRSFGALAGSIAKASG